MHDKNSTTGQNIHTLMTEADPEDFHEKNINFFKLNRKVFKKRHTFEQLDESEIWKINLIKDLTYMKREAIRNKDIESENDAELTTDEIIHSLKEICTK